MLALHLCGDDWVADSYSDLMLGAFGQPCRQLLSERAVSPVEGWFARHIEAGVVMCLDRARLSYPRAQTQCLRDIVVLC